MSGGVVAVIICIFRYLTYVSGVRLPSCVNGRLTLNEKLTSNDILCDQLDITKQMSWSLSLPSSQTLGDCDASNSCLAYRPYFTLSRSGGSSTLTIAQSQYSNIGTNRIGCVAQEDPVQATCDLNVVYPPDVTCTASFISGSWTLSLSCDVTKTYSSRDTYWCAAYRGTTQDSQTTPIGSETYSTTAHSLTPYRQGTCSFSINNLGGGTSLPRDSQLYFRVDVYPGPTTVVKGPLSIVPPASPTITCPALVEENVPFICTCTTHFIGHPPAGLQWSGTSSVSVTGNYNDSSLTTPSVTLFRQDHGRTTLTCVVMWADGTNRRADYTANVGYKPENLRLLINSAQSNATVNENENVTLTCEADSRPVGTVILEKEGEGRLNIGQSPLVHKVGVARCEDTRRYHCSASNILGQSATVTKQLFVTCPPRGPASVEAVNMADVPVSRHFNITAFPPPTEVAFSYTSLINCSCGSDVSPDLIGLTGSCVPGTSLAHQARCTVTVHNVTRREAAGLYRLIVRNLLGETTVTMAVLKDEAADLSRNDNTSPAVVALGIVVAVVVTAFVVVLLWVWRRHWYLPCTDSERQRTQASRDERHTIMPQVNYTVDAQELTLASDQGASSTKPENSMTIYSQLTSSEVGQRSIYSQLSQGTGDLGAKEVLYSNT